MISLTKHNELKGYKSLDVYPEVAHFVTTRHEGISTGAYGSFNCSPYTNDSCMNVNRNQSLFRPYPSDSISLRNQQNSIQPFLSLRLILKYLFSFSMQK